MSYKIGYIDEDIHQVRKFTRLLEEEDLHVIGYDIKRGMPLEDLISEVYKSDIDLLMIDYMLTNGGVLQFDGDTFEREYNEIKPNFPHIIFTSNESDAFEKVDNPNIIYEKGVAIGNVEKFASILRKNIENYRSYTTKRKRIIQQLQEKGESDNLDFKEKEELLQAQLELSNLDKRQPKEIPLQLISNQTLDEVQELQRKAKKFLQSLQNK